MPLLKAQKKELAQTYLKKLHEGRNISVLSFDKMPVNEINKLRMKIADAKGTLQVVKKRVLLKSLDDAFSGLTLQQAPTSVMLLLSYNDEDAYAPLKVINTFSKYRAKEKKECEVRYVGGWFDGSWQVATRVAELAGLPTKEELVGKFLFLLNHPMSSFARALQAIADKKTQE